MEAPVVYCRMWQSYRNIIDREYSIVLKMNYKLYLIINKQKITKFYHLYRDYILVVLFIIILYETWKVYFNPWIFFSLHFQKQQFWINEYNER